MNAPDEIMAVLRGTALEGMAVRPAPDGDDVLVVEWPKPDDVLTGWRAARSVMDRTGRRPVAVSDDYESLWFPDVEPARLAELEAASLAPDPWREVERWDSGEPDEPIDLDTVENFLDFWKAGPEWDSEEVARELLPGVPAGATLEVVQRHLLDRVTGDPALTARLRNAQEHQTSGALDWHVPERVQLALLPTTRAWLPMAWLDYFETDPEVLAAAMRQWHQRWGAELVASWGTMLQFVTTRRPDFGPDAWDLAQQQLSLAGNLDMPQIALAWDLAHSNAWFLHNRP